MEIIDKTINAEVLEVPSRSYQDALNVSEEGRNITNAFGQVTSELNYGIQQFNYSIQDMGNSNQRYINAENNKQWIDNNEVQKYNELIKKQNNLLIRINSTETKIWRYNDKLYYRTNSGKLIINNNIEIQKEISSRYGQDIYIVNDINDVLQNNSEIRVNTVYIAINCLPVIDAEIFDYINRSEILRYPNDVCKRNLLAHTQFMKNKILHRNNRNRYIIKLMSKITKQKQDCISSWINNITLDNDKILLLIGNQKLSEDLIVDKVIKRLFDTNIFITLTDEMLQTLTPKEIVSGKLFLHINNIPKDETNRDILKELLISIIIHKSIVSDEGSIPIQTKVIVTIDEANPFFSNFIEIIKTLFIDTEENLLIDLEVNNLIPIYKDIEKSLNYYACEVLSHIHNSFNLDKNDNKEYLEHINEVLLENLTDDNYLPVLDPYSESYENIISNYERFKHTYIIANQGFGKSQLIISLIMRDYILNDCSVVLLDPHGDLAEDLLRIIPDKERLVYIDLYLDSYTMPTINLFDSIDNNDEDTIYQVTQLIMSVFKNISSEDKLNGLMENVAENCISVMLREGGGSFWELYQFLGGTGSKDW